MKRVDLELDYGELGYELVDLEVRINDFPLVGWNPSKGKIPPAARKRTGGFSQRVFLLVSGWEGAHRRNEEVDRQEWLHVVMPLATPGEPADVALHEDVEDPVRSGREVGDVGEHLRCRPLDVDGMLEIKAHDASIRRAPMASAPKAICCGTLLATSMHPRGNMTFTNDLLS